MASQTMLAEMKFSISGTPNSHVKIICEHQEIGIDFISQNWLYLG